MRFIALALLALVSLSDGRVTAQQGVPASPETVETIVVYEEGLRFAQQFVFGVGLLTSCGAKGGPENLSAQTPVNGGFDLYDAWIGLAPGSCTTVSADKKLTLSLAVHRSEAVRP